MAKSAIVPRLPKCLIAYLRLLVLGVFTLLLSADEGTRATCVETNKINKALKAEQIINLKPRSKRPGQVPQVLT